MCERPPDCAPSRVGPILFGMSLDVVYRSKALRLAAGASTRTNFSRYTRQEHRKSSGSTWRTKLTIGIYAINPATQRCKWTAIADGIANGTALAGSRGNASCCGIT
jgi:hypothetical protein